MSEDWFARRTHRWQDWSLEDLLRAKAETRVSLVVPARNEAATVGDVVTRVRERLLDTVGLLDEIVVIDSDSTDDTYAVATDAGAVVHRASEIRPDLGWMPGKGEAMWKSLFVTSGDVLVFMDADLLDWDSHFVPGLLGPLLTTPEVALVKGFYERPMLENGTLAPDSSAYEGGRVTELVARPLIALLFPELAGLVQPLAGEWAVRRSLFASLHVPTGYAVELAALIDTLRSHGLDAIAQVDLGRRAHRHQALRDLGAMATQIIAAAQRRAGAPGPNTVLLQQFGHGRSSEDASIAPLVRDVGTGERPPAAALPGATPARGRSAALPGRVPHDAPERALGHTTQGAGAALPGRVSDDAAERALGHTTQGSGGALGHTTQGSAAGDASGPGGTPAAGAAR